ncbi:Light-mediated development protein DET1 [Galdieria sulphuraria]|nr:Light-mediated development protein DET1 [Galdieria sulphuraria]
MSSSENSQDWPRENEDQFMWRFNSFRSPEPSTSGTQRRSETKDSVHFCLLFLEWSALKVNVEEQQGLIESCHNPT